MSVPTDLVFESTSTLTQDEYSAVLVGLAFEAVSVLPD
jgi:hypothetical protein